MQKVFRKLACITPVILVTGFVAGDNPRNSAAQYSKFCIAAFIDFDGDRVRIFLDIDHGSIDAADGNNAIVFL